MNLLEKYQDIIEFAGCNVEMGKYAEMIRTLEESKTKNIAILGETNSGKTSLINRLCGGEVRKPTRISLGEEPLMVTFGSNEVMEGFEKVDVRNEKCAELKIAFFEIPINVAIDYDTKQPTQMLEAMDAVIYVVSAIAPFTGSDASNLKAIADKFPLMIWVSKTEMLDGEDEYRDCMEYIKREFSYHFKDSFCEFYDERTEDLFGSMLGKFADINLDEIREYHKIRIEQAARKVMEDKLKLMFSDIQKEHKKRVQEAGRADESFRQTQLVWNEIRMQMMEKEQETVDYLDKRLSAAKISTKKEAISELKSAKDKKEWLSHDFKDVLERSINHVAQNAMTDAKEMSDAHVAWLVSEVNRKFDKILDVRNMEQGITPIGGKTGECNSSPDYRKLAMAAGTGLVAGGAIFSSLSLIPTCIVAIPASVLTVSLIKGGMDDYERYNQSLVRFVEECCDSNYGKISKELHTCIYSYYDKVIADAMKLSDEKSPAPDFQDIECKENEINEKLFHLQQMMS